MSEHRPRIMLTDDERRQIKSMSLYWHELRQRQDASPIHHEVQAVVRLLGPWRLLDAVEIAACAE